MKKKWHKCLASILSALCLISCQKQWMNGDGGSYGEKYYINSFGYSIMNSNYLWSEEVQTALDNWNLVSDDPEEAVAEVRYKDAGGKDIDKWTVMTPEFSSLNQSVSGTSVTFGYSLAFHTVTGSDTQVVASVRYTCKDSPAAAAGLKRGDVITAVDGVALTKANYYTVATEKMYGSDPIKLTLYSGNTVSLTPVSMYEEPVLLAKTFEQAGRKAGYLIYNSFTPQSYTTLMEAAEYFKQENVTDVIIDLRYNSGGYAVIEETLASMLGPESAVNKGEILHREIYNSNIGETETAFTTSFDFTIDGKKYSYSTKNYNIGAKHLYAIVSGSSASASESLLTGLIPYMDVTLVGSKTYGKFCGGILLSAEEWYEYFKSQLDEIDPSFYENGIKHCADWGIYLMTSRYADKNGDTPSMPDGMEPDIEVSDNPLDGYQLGDPSETMLRAALSAAGFDTSLLPATQSVSRTSPGAGEELGYEKPGTGLVYLSLRGASQKVQYL